MIKKEYCTIEKDKSDVIHITFTKASLHLTTENSAEIFSSRISLSPENTKQLVLVDLRNDPKPDKGAREFAQSKKIIDSTKAIAFIVKSGLSSVLATLFLGVNKGNYPVKLFTNKEEAMKWLKSL